MPIAGALVHCELCGEITHPWATADAKLRHIGVWSATAEPVRETRERVDDEKYGQNRLRSRPAELQIQMVASPRNQRYLLEEVVGF
jgi:hypothetical protein